MGAVAGHVADCAPERSRECFNDLADGCDADCEASLDEAVDGASDSPSLDEISVRNLCSRLSRLAGAEGGTKHGEIYQSTLVHALALLVDMIPKAGAATVAMTRCILVVAPAEELNGMDFREEASSCCSSSAGSLTGMTVQSANFEQGFGKLLSRQELNDSADDESPNIILAVDFYSGIVRTSLLAEHVDPLEIAGRLTRGVVFSRSTHGMVCVFPAADVQRGQAWQVIVKDNVEDEPLDPRTFRVPRFQGRPTPSTAQVVSLSSASSSSKYHSIDCVYKDPVTGGKVYVGGHAVAKNLKLLQKYNITKIVNCQDITSENFFEEHNGLDYLRFPVTSWSRAPHAETNAGVLNFFAPLFKFVDHALAKGESVLIHCLAGAFRSGTAAAAVLMHRTAQSSAEALKDLQRRRPVVNTILDLGELLERLDCALERTVTL